MPPVLGSVKKPSAKPTRTTNAPNRTWLHVFVVLLAGLLARIPVYLAFRPISSGDSPSYYIPFYLWTKHIFYMGERTPVYPLFLALAQRLSFLPLTPFLSPRASYIAIVMQSALDVLAAVIFYFTLRALRIRGSIAIGAALVLVTIPAVCIFEVNILNMTLAFASLAFVIHLFILTMNRLQAGKGAMLAALSTGAALAIAVMNRPDLLIFCVLMLLLAAALCQKLQQPGPTPRFSTRAWSALALMALPVALSVLAWMTLMYVGIGEFRITTADGWNRSRTAYNMFDRVDPEDRVIGELMSQTYLRQKDKTDKVNVREIMWQVQYELLANFQRYPITDPTIDASPFHLKMYKAAHDILGMGKATCASNPGNMFCWEQMRMEIDIGDYLGAVSWKLARKYPFDWMHNIVANFFEESFTFRYGDAKPAVEGYQPKSTGPDSFVKDPSIASRAWPVANVEAPLLTLMYVVTLGYAIGFPLIVFRKQDGHWLHDAAVATLAIASIGTIVGTCILAGFNRIYTMPHIVVFVLCTTYALENRARIVSALGAIRLKWAPNWA